MNSRRHSSDPTSPRTPVRLEEYASELYRFLVQRLRGSGDAEDLLQSTYVRFLQTPHHELVRQPRAYLYRIATNMVTEFNLRLRRAPVTYDSEAAAASADEVLITDDADDAFANQLDLQERLERIVSQLPQAYRAVLLMRTLEGLSFKEIGERCGITELSARKYLVRAVARCRAADWRE